MGAGQPCPRGSRLCGGPCPQQFLRLCFLARSDSVALCDGLVLSCNHSQHVKIETVHQLLILDVSSVLVFLVLLVFPYTCKLSNVLSSDQLLCLTRRKQISYRDNAVPGHNFLYVSWYCEELSCPVLHGRGNNYFFQCQCLVILLMFQWVYLIPLELLTSGTLNTKGNWKYALQIAHPHQEACSYFLKRPEFMGPDRDQFTVDTITT